MNKRRDFLVGAGLALGAPMLAAATAKAQTSSGGTIPTVLQYGARGDGSTDDTQAFNKALAANPVVYVPPQRYVVGNVVVNSGNTLIGMMGGPAYTSLGASAKPTLVARSGATCVLDVHQAVDFTIDGLGIDGGNRQPHGISDGGHFGSVRNLTVVNCARGLGGNLGSAYSQVLHITACEFASCDMGVTNLIDCTMTDCAVSACRLGLYMGNGASSTNFVSLRAEWCSGYDILLDHAFDLQFTGGMVDRGAAAGIASFGCTGLQFTGMVMRRCASLNLTTNSAGLYCDSHWYFESSSKVLITGCRTRIGADDNGGGNTTPKYAIRYGAGNSNFALTGSDFSGRTAASFIGTTPTGYAQQGNIGL